MLRHTLSRAAAAIKKEGDISSVFASLSNEAAVELPLKYAQLKRSLVSNPDALQDSWHRLKRSLKTELAEIKERGPSVIPIVEYSELDHTSKSSIRDEIAKRGCVVVRNVLPASEALELKAQAREYIKANPSTKAFPPENPAVYELYWSPSQVKARSDPRMLKTQSFMNSLWHSSDPASLVSFKHNVTYADRIRIRPAGDARFALGPHVDGGSLERWEDPEYSSVYKDIYKGNWERYDAYDAKYRIDAVMDLHDGAGACAVFRSFQGWLSMSEVSRNEGSLLLAPLVKQITAYFLLRPLFENDKLNFDSTMFHGAAPGRGQEFSQILHPDLDLANTMVPIPKVQPGDAVFWHCDLIHAVDPIHRGKSDSSVLYIPAAPLCRLNVDYLVRQREAFARGIPGPDFPGYPHALGESQHVGRADQAMLQSMGHGGMQGMGLDAFDVLGDMTAGELDMVRIANETLGFASK